jgi:hypothetical protein
MDRPVVTECAHGRLRPGRLCVHCQMVGARPPLRPVVLGVATIVNVGKGTITVASAFTVSKDAEQERAGRRET